MLNIKVGFFWKLLIFFILAFLSLFLLATIVPSSELSEQLLYAAKVALYAVVIFFVANIANSSILRLINFQLRYFTSEERGLNKTRVIVAKHIVSSIIYLIAFVLVLKLIPGLADLAFSLLAGAGIIAIIIGFAAKDVASNLIAGLFIAIFQPFRVGDKILFNKIRGTVEEITMRHTVIRTWDNQRLIVPNSKLTESVIVNYSLKDERCVETIEIPISYTADIEKAKEIIIEEIKKHKDYIEPNASSEYLAKHEPIKVRVVDIAESAIILRAYFWAKNKPTGFRMAADLREAIKKRFDAEGIEIPYPYRNIIMKNGK